MLNEAPKKNSDAPLTRGRLFWRNVWECFRRSVTPFLMYFFMSLIMLACQLINNLVANVILGVVCILAGAFFNGHLLYTFGARHYGEFLNGEARRRNAAFGAVTTLRHHPEREYRPWKGFAIGAFVGLPVLVFGTLAGLFYDRLGGEMAGSIGASASQIALVMIAGWAIIPTWWFGTRVNAENQPVGFKASPFYSLLFLLLPLIVSGVFYILGAALERRKREEAAERVERVKQAREEAKKAAQTPKPRVQTEEQRKKTLQSKKKK